jgi:hypothetical protein
MPDRQPVPKVPGIPVMPDGPAPDLADHVPSAAGSVAALQRTGGTAAQPPDSP